MDHIAGDLLENVWPDMTCQEKDSIASQLRGVLVKLRSQRSDTGRIEACDGGPATDCGKICEYLGGPFHNEADFNDFLMDIVKTTPQPLRAALRSKLRSDHETVFTHGDLTQHNIIVRDGQIVGLIDWEYSGWFREHWEYIKFFERFSKAKDWKDYAHKIFPKVYDDELVVYQALVRWQKP